MRHFLTIIDHEAALLQLLLKEAAFLKAEVASKRFRQSLKNRTVALVFEKPSLRTRVSFEAGIAQLGGNSLFQAGNEVGLGVRESLADFARTLSQYVDGIVLRVFRQATVEGVARNATVPVINGLTDLSHPCQIMADLLTIIEQGHSLPGLQLAWLGDGNNVLHSLIEAAGLMKFTIKVGCPEGFEPDSGFVARAKASGAVIEIIRNSEEAVAGAQVVVTDCWVSMGQPGGEAKIAAMAPYQVNSALMSAAATDAMFLHCLPAHRGEEVTDAVIDGAQSRVWDEAENRIHGQKSVLRWVFGQL